MAILIAIDYFFSLFENSNQNSFDIDVVDMKTTVLFLYVVIYISNQ